MILEKKALREFFILNQPRSWMQYMELKIHLNGRGYNYIEDYGLLPKRLEDLEENATIKVPIILHDGIYAGGYAYFIKPEDDEDDLPDTLPGGFAGNSNYHNLNHGTEMVLTRLAPSELILFCRKIQMPLEKVSSFSFEHPRGYDVLVESGMEQFRSQMGRSLRYYLKRDDIVTLTRMEKKNYLDLVVLKDSMRESARKARNSLKERLIPGGLAILMKNSKSKYTLSRLAQEGEYIAKIRT